MRKITPAILAAAFAAAPFASGSAQDITSISATFANSVPASNTSIDNSDADAIQVCWPSTVSADCSTLGTADNLSGYMFERANTSITPVIGSPFALGTFTHFNFPVSLASPGPLTSVDLIFSFSIDGATPGNFGDTWTLSHEETNNATSPCPYAGGDPCADRVTFAIAGGGAPTPFSIGGTNYILSLFGFGATADLASLNPAFITFENQANETQLWAQITEAPPTSTVPEPATMTLLATGLAGMAAARKRRKS
ncbi:MAG TPA: THxN family PEP-CTERM protein [Gemmatimonadales bacterium]|nr:THxN family PEP-CTERM protein [Gemmatimonadales bacterium]